MTDTPGERVTPVSESADAEGREMRRRGLQTTATDRVRPVNHAIADFAMRGLSVMTNGRLRRPSARRRRPEAHARRVAEQQDATEVVAEHRDAEAAARTAGRDEHAVAIASHDAGIEGDRRAAVAHRAAATGRR